MKGIVSRIFIIIGVICLIIGILIGTSIPKKQNTDDVYTIKQVENYVFLGDSITEWYPLDQFFDEYPVVNSGRAAYKTKDILDQLENMVYIYNPTKIFILIGTNDLNNEDSSKETIIENLNLIIKNIKENRPKAEIYVESIYPINRTDNEKIVMTTVGKRTNKKIKEVNKNIALNCKELGVAYIDMYKELIDEEGNLNLEYTKDGLHLSEYGYDVVTKKRMSYMQKERNEKKK